MTIIMAIKNDMMMTKDDYNNEDEDTVVDDDGKHAMMMITIFMVMMIMVIVMAIAKQSSYLLCLQQFELLPKHLILPSAWPPIPMPGAHIDLKLMQCVCGCRRL